MYKCLLSAFLFTAIVSFSCNNPDKPVINKTDSVVGNTDSSGSQPVQPVQPGPGSANGGNAADTLNRNSDQKVRTDSVIRH
jgi:hypothetical protein